MPTFTAQEKNPAAKVAAPPEVKPYRVPKDCVRDITGNGSFFVADLDTSDPHTGWDRKLRDDMTEQDLIQPGVWDDCEGTLRARAIVLVQFGPNPVDTQFMILSVVAEARKGLRGFERQRGLVQRDHSVVKAVLRAKKGAPNWGDQPLDPVEA